MSQEAPETSGLAATTPEPPTAPMDDAASAQRANAGWLANLRQRLGSAAILIALVVGIVFFGGWIAFAGALGFLFWGAWELSALFANKGWRPQMVLSVALGIDFMCAAMFPNQRLLIISGGISASIILSFTVVLFTRVPFENALRDWALTVAIPFYLGWPLALALAIRGAAFGLGSTGFWWLVATFLMVWGNDSGAYFAGHYFGKTKLAPRVSPAKTWEGFAGGLAVSILAAFILTYWTLHLPWYAWLSMGIFTAIAATIGDLAESLLKRGVDAKDSGQLIPGHGGILDRMDSLLFALLVVATYAAIYDPHLLH